MIGDLITIFYVLESSHQYEHIGAIKRRLGANFDKTRGSIVTGLVGFDWIRVVDGSQSIKAIFGCD